MTIVLVILGVILVVFFWWFFNDYARDHKDSSLVVNAKQVLRVVAWIWLIVVGLDVAGTLLDKVGERQCLEWGLMVIPGILAVFMSKP